MSVYKARQTTRSSPFPGPTPPHTTAQGLRPYPDSLRPMCLLGQCSKGHTGVGRAGIAPPGTALLSAHLWSDSFLSGPSSKDMGISRQISGAFSKKTLHLHGERVRESTCKNHFMFNTHPQSHEGPRAGRQVLPGTQPRREGLEDGMLSTVSMATSCSGDSTLPAAPSPPNPRQSSVQSIFRILFPPFSALLLVLLAPSSRTDIIHYSKAQLPPLLGSADGFSLATQGQLTTLPPPSPSHHFQCVSRASPF